jgi:PAS domain S-box-containing protein
VEFEGYYPAMNIWFFVKVYPSSDGLTIFYNNITERKKAQEQIAAEKILSESIINSLPGIFYLYDRKGKFIRWNKNFEIITGYSAEEISTLHPLDFFSGDEMDLIREKIDTIFTTGNSTDVTAHLCIKSKKRIPYYFNGSRANFGGTDYLIGMGIDITDRVEAENRLRERAEEIQKLTAHLQSIREEERTHIAREIHDVLGQQLTALKMDASWTARKIGDENKDISARITGMIALIDETVKTVRRISSELRPGILDDLGLTAALEWQGHDFEKRTGIRSEFHTDLHDFYPERNLSTNIFRVYQEALTNVARHAGATKIETTLEEKEGCIILVIKDNGTGFDMEQAKNKKSLGLIGMRERALLFQGELAVKSERGKGTVITLKIPWIETANKKL